MAIYRGPGGAGDATADTTNNSEIATTKAAEAAASATDAASSAGAAANSAASALTSETDAQGYANAAATSAGEAAASVIEAQEIVDSIGTAVDDAQTAASDAAASAVTAESAANDAVDSAALAQDWATYTAGPVAGGEYSAKYNAQVASGYADDAADQVALAAVQVGLAEDQVALAETQVGLATTQATNAASSASAAATSATNAAASYDAFDDRYLGAKSTAPSVDNDGNALLTGALYWNTGGSQLYVWDGSVWQAAAFSATGAVVAVNATSPISSTGGTSPTISIAQATTSTSGYLSSTDWNTFNNKTSNTGTVTSVNMSVPTGLAISGNPVTTTGTLAVTLASGYAIPTTSSQTNWDTAYTDRNKWDGGATGLDASTGRTSLGLGTMAVETATNYLTTANAASTYLTQSNASSTYQTQAGMSSYLTTSTAASTYQTQSGMSSYLTTSSASSTYAPIASPTFTGTATTVGVKETKVATSSNTVNLSNGTYFTHTLSGATTLAVSNTASSGLVSAFILDLTNGGSATITWWSGVKWASGTAPTLTSSGRDVLGFFTHDGGTTWNGLVLGKDVK